MSEESQKPGKLPLPLLVMLSSLVIGMVVIALKFFSVF